MLVPSASACSTQSLVAWSIRTTKAAMVNHAIMRRSRIGARLAVAVQIGNAAPAKGCMLALLGDIVPIMPATRAFRSAARQDTHRDARDTARNGLGVRAGADSQRRGDEDKAQM